MKLIEPTLIFSKSEVCKVFKAYDQDTGVNARIYVYEGDEKIVMVTCGEKVLIEFRIGKDVKF